MAIYLHKILPFFFLPTGIVLVLLAVGFLRRSRFWVGCAFVFFFLSSMPLVSNGLLRLVEHPFTRGHAQSMPVVDAIVVLGEGQSIAPGAEAISEWNDGDRFWGGVDLFKAGKAPLLVFTGGWIPWARQTQTDGEVLMSFAARLGIPEENMSVTEKASNTQEEATAVKKLIGKEKRLLLVTSAFHMTCAQKLFKAQGFKVIPFPVDFKSEVSKNFSIIDICPKAKAFEKTEMVFREFLGRAFYAFRNFLMTKLGRGSEDRVVKSPAKN